MTVIELKRRLPRAVVDVLDRMSEPDAGVISKALGNLIDIIDEEGEYPLSKEDME